MDSKITSNIINSNILQCFFVSLAITINKSLMALNKYIIILKLGEFDFTLITNLILMTQDSKGYLLKVTSTFTRLFLVCHDLLNVTQLLIRSVPK